MAPPPIQLPAIVARPLHNSCGPSSPSSDGSINETKKRAIGPHPEFRNVEIAKVEQRKGSTKKTGVKLEDLGSVIGDIVLTDTTGKKWFISLKDKNGATVSALPGAGSLFNNAGDLQPNSEGAELLLAFGVDLNKVQAGFDERGNKKKIRSKLPVGKAAQKQISTHGPRHGASSQSPA